MKDNKGFTLVEILVVIVVLSGVMILTISQIQKVSINSRIKLCKSKISIIEENINNYLINNSDGFSKNDEISNKDGICLDTVVNNTCLTNVELVAKLGIVDYDKDNKVVNPVDNKELNSYNISISYDNISNKYEASILNLDNDYDVNYNTICGPSAGLSEGDADKSIFDNYDYNFYVNRDGENIFISNYNIKKNEIGNYCKNLNFEDKDLYNYQRYSINQDSVYCYYEKKPFYKLNINKDDNVSLEYDVKESYIIGTSLNIKYNIINNKILKEWSCSPNNSCEIDTNNKNIIIKFINEDVTLNISSKDKYNIGMYYENIDDDNYSYDKSVEFESLADVDNYCKNNIERGFYFDKFENNSCYYKRDRASLNFYINNNGVNAISKVSLSDGNVLTSNNTFTYKVNQKVTLNVNYNSGYEFDSYDCSDTLDCNLNDDGTITVSVGGNGNVIVNGSLEKPKYNVYYHFQNADNENGYSSTYEKSKVAIDSTIPDSILLQLICHSFDKYNYVSSISYYDQSKSEVNCYYDRKLISVKINFADKYVTSTTIVPSSNAITSTSTLSGSKTISFRYGQELILSSTYSTDYTLGSVVCTNNTGCTTYNNGITKVIVPDINNYTITINSKDIVENFTIYKHYQDADNENGYNSVNKGTLNISLPANYDGKDEQNLNNRDVNNVNRYCTLSSEDSGIYTSNNVISYLDRSKHELNCYYDRKLVSVKFDNSDAHVTGVTVVPNNNQVSSGISINNTNTYSYRYGQEVLMKINGYVTDYMYKEVSCSNSSLCNIGSDGTTKIKATENITVKPISKPIEIPYKLYNHYQDADNENGYTAEYIKTVGVVLSVGDNTNYNNVCSTQSKAHFKYNNVISYLDRSKKEINCYFDRELVSVKFDNSDAYVTGVTVVPNSSSVAAGISITNTNTYSYRYGQEVLMKINGYVTDYMYKEVSCFNSSLCNIGSDGTTKIKATENITVKPISKPIELSYKLYNHYQDERNENGYTSEVKNISVVLSVGDVNNTNNFCSQEGKSGYSYKSAISYLDRSKKEINCYFNRN